MGDKICEGNGHGIFLPAFPDENSWDINMRKARAQGKGGRAARASARVEHPSTHISANLWLSFDETRSH